MTPGDPLRLHAGRALSSFTEHLRMHAPDLLPANRFPASDLTATKDLAPHGTTIVAVTYRGGVLIAGDRRATMGNLLASRDTEKVYITDTFSAAGIAGTAGIAIEMVRLFAVESLFDAADDDTATGGPDMLRGIFPTAVVIDADGAEEIGEDRLAEIARGVIADREAAEEGGAVR